MAADLGVSKFMQCSEEALALLLNFPNGCPTLFTKFRSASGLCAWDGDNAKRFILENSNMQPLCLLWHQLVGVTSVIDKAFTTKPVEAGLPGVLIADAVGVGKTALSMGVITFIIDAFFAQKAAAGQKVRGKVFQPDLLSTGIRFTPIIGNHFVFRHLQAR